ncbi:MAG TPA: type II toxin-antitoxin system RelE/ParE family toxin [Thermodesulfobacteriota bacterium]|nr:type II toxin-antitoxin system RelE/ParE family toxin [Thermodesulfobacteriota bacterium]
METYRIKILPTAQKELASLPKTIQIRIGKKIDSLQTNPTPQGVKLLKGKEREAYRVRVGDYRILYQIKKDVLTVLVIKIGHRSEVYRAR